MPDAAVEISGLVSISVQLNSTVSKHLKCLLVSTDVFCSTKAIVA